jgi:hypothetical protein
MRRIERFEHAGKVVGQGALEVQLLVRPWMLEA